MGTPLIIHFRLKLVWQGPTLVLHLPNHLIKLHRDFLDPEDNLINPRASAPHECWSKTEQLINATRGNSAFGVVTIAHPSCPENEIRDSYQDCRHAGRPSWTCFTFLERLVRGIPRMLWVISRLGFSNRNPRRSWVSLI